MTVLTELTAWLQSRLNGDWEHDFGISIQSTDNPGWWVKISLTGTPLETKDFTSVDRGIADSNDWLRCYIENKVFNGAGDLNKLEEILRVFLMWAK